MGKLADAISKMSKKGSPFKKKTKKEREEEKKKEEKRKNKKKSLRERAYKK